MKAAQWSLVLSCVLSLATLHSVSAKSSSTDISKCTKVENCCSCVATPGCSWFYNTPLGDFCKETPRVGTSILQRRSPYRLEHLITIPKNKDEPIDISSKKKNVRIHMSPQEIRIKQGVGMRQEVIFRAASNSSKLAFRIIDFTNRAVQYTVVATNADSCPGKPEEMEKSDMNFQLKWDGYSKARNKILIKVDGRKKRIHGEKSYMRVICWRNLDTQATNETEFKLILDTPSCFMGERTMMIEMPWQRTRKRVLLKISNDDCKCPCQKNKKMIFVELFEKKCAKRGKHGKHGKGHRCFREANKVSKDFNCKAENDKCQRAPYEDMCSGKGTCLCGRCVCVPGKSGEHCECDDSKCPFYKGAMCGGKLRGTCDCGKCRCHGERSGKACELAYIPDSCRFQKGPACSGHGSCVDGKCECHDQAAGPLCHIRDRCPDFRHCVQCHLLGYDAFSIDRFCARCKVLKDVDYKDLSDMKEGTMIDAECHFQDSKACKVNYKYNTIYDEMQRPVKSVVYVDTRVNCTKVEQPTVEKTHGRGGRVFK